MALGSAPSREDIWLELTESTYRNGGINNNHLQDMYEYVFGDTTGNYSRNAFGGYGIPVIATSISLSSGDQSIDVDFTINNLAEPNSPTIEAFAEYYDDSLGGFPSSTNYQSLGTYTSTGAKSGTITGLSNGTTYRVRVTLVNVFNNTEDFPTYPSTSVHYDFTNSATATPTSPQLSTPTLSGQTVEYNSAEGYVSFSYSDDEDSFDVQVRVDGGSAETATVDCFNNNVGTSSNPKEIRFTWNTVPNSSVDVRVRATSGSQTDSNWSSWESATFVTLINLPSCPL